jgi:membrane-bound lytic murein transglycosylase F
MIRVRSCFVLFFIVVIAALGCSNESYRDNPWNLPIPVDFDLEEIKKRGTLILLTENTPSTYYLYRSQQKGFDYEVARAFAKSMGVKLQVVVVDDFDQLFFKLNKGDGDLIASNLTITPERLKVVAFSMPVYQSSEVVVQPKFSDNNGLAIHDSNSLNQLDIYVHRYSSFYETLKEYERRSGSSLRIHEAPGEISTDELIRLTDEGEIPATITDQNLALLRQAQYPLLDMSVPITGERQIAVAMRKNAPELLKAFNAWLESKNGSAMLNSLYERYFEPGKVLGYRGTFTIPEITANHLSPYDSLFKIYAKEIPWDWRLLAALSFQESRFNPNAVSWSGAFGLMQLMPETALRFGCDTNQREEENIRASAKYIKFLDRFWKNKIQNPEERLKFVLASYNIGPGHIADACVIALNNGKCDTLWDEHVAPSLLLKTEKKFFTLEGVKHGYCNAIEPFNFVQKVLGTFEYFEGLKNRDHEN